MSRQDKLEQERAIALAAQRLLQEPLIERFFFDYEKATVEQLVTAADATARESLVLRLRVLRDFRKHLDRYINTGKLAEAELNHGV